MNSVNLVEKKKDTLEKKQSKSKQIERVNIIQNAISRHIQEQLEHIDCEGFLERKDLKLLFQKKEQPLDMYKQHAEGLTRMAQDTIMLLEKSVLQELAQFPFQDKNSLSRAQDIFSAHMETLQKAMKETKYRTEYIYTFFTQDFQKVRMLPTHTEFELMKTMADSATKDMSTAETYEYKKNLLNVFAPIYVDGTSELANICMSKFSENHDLQMQFVRLSFTLALDELKKTFGFNMNLPFAQESRSSLRK